MGLFLGKCNANCLRNLFLFLAKKNEYLVDNPTTKTFYFKRLITAKKKIITSGQFVKVDLNEKQKTVLRF